MHSKQTTQVTHARKHAFSSLWQRKVQKAIGGDATGPEILGISYNQAHAYAAAITQLGSASSSKTRWHADRQKT